MVRSVLLLVPLSLSACLLPDAADDDVSAADAGPGPDDPDAAPPPPDAGPPPLPGVAGNQAPLPVTVQELLPQGDVWADFFGGAVAISPDGAVIAIAATHDEGYGTEEPRGSVYVFEADAEGQFQQVAFIYIPGMHAFGETLATDGKYLAIGTRGLTWIGPGEVHLYGRSPEGVWEPATILASPEPSPWFGHSILFDGHALLVGADTFIAAFARNPDGEWVDAGRLDPPLSQELGTAPLTVALGGDVLAIGDYDAYIGNYPVGQVLVYERVLAGGWELATTIPSTTSAGYGYGYRLAVGADRIAIAEDGSWPTVEVWERTDGTWAATARLSSGLTGFFQPPFGQTMAFAGDQLWIGTGTWVSPPYNDPGHLYLFEHGASGWSATGQLVPPGLAVSDNLGYAVATGGGRVVVGADTDDTACPSMLNCNAGAVYVFTAP